MPKKAKAKTRRRIATDSVAAIIADCGIRSGPNKAPGDARIMAASGLSRSALYKWEYRGRIELDHVPMLDRLSRGRVTLDRVLALNAQSPKGSPAVSSRRLEGQAAG